MNSIENTLQKKYMIAKFSTGKYNILKKDKRGSQAGAEKYGAEEILCKFTKQAIPKEYIDAIQKNISDFRTYLYKYSSPWSHKGEVLFPCVFYKKIMDKERETAIIHEDLVKDFLNNWDLYKTEAARRLNGLYKESDYPDISKVTKKFKWNLTFIPVPAAGNFQIDIAEDIKADIMAGLSTSNQIGIDKAMASAWSRVFESIKSLSEKMKETRKNKKGEETAPVFRDSIIENIKELTEILPDLNITGDQALEAARQDLIKDIAGLDPDTLRENKQLRIDTAAAADKILNKIENLF